MWWGPGRASCTSGPWQPVRGGSWQAGWAAKASVASLMCPLERLRAVVRLGAVGPWPQQRRQARRLGSGLGRGRLGSRGGSCWSRLWEATVCCWTWMRHSATHSWKAKRLECSQYTWIASPHWALLVPECPAPTPTNFLRTAMQRVYSSWPF